MKSLSVKMLTVFLLVWGLALGGPVLAKKQQSVKPEPQSKETRAVQSQLDEGTEEKVADQRERILAEANAALAESRKALKALDENKPEDALRLLELAAGKLALVVARDPGLALAPVNVKINSYDVYADIETIKDAVKQAEDYLEDGEVQKARSLVASLASEIVIETVNIPLATYPEAIKDVVPLIDKGKIDDAKRDLQLALNTLVVVKEKVIPLPVVRAEALLKSSEVLAEKQDRSDVENKQLTAHLDEAENQLKIAKLLGYGDKKAFKPIYKQLDKIRKKTKDSKSGEGFFDKIKKQISDF